MNEQGRIKITVSIIQEGFCRKDKLKNCHRKFGGRHSRKGFLKPCTVSLDFSKGTKYIGRAVKKYV